MSQPIRLTGLTVEKRKSGVNVGKEKKKNNSERPIQWVFYGGMYDECRMYVHRSYIFFGSFIVHLQ